MHILVLALPIVLTVGVIVLVTQFGRAARTVRLSPPHAAAAQTASSRVQLRNRFALLVSVLASIATGVLGLAATHDLTWLVLLAPVVGATVAALVFIIVPSAEFLESDAVRSAELSPRRARDFARVWPPYAAAAVLGVVAALIALLAEPDGRSLAHDFGVGGSGGGPYPGWYYAAPLIAATVVLSALTDLALRRVARAPRPSDATLRDADDAVRTLAVQLICRVSTASILVSLGALLIAAALVSMRVADGPDTSTDGVDVSPPTFAPLMALGVAELVIGLLSLAAGLVVTVLALRLAARRAFEVAE